MAGSRGQRSEDRGQKTEDRRQRTEDRGQRTEDRGQKTEDRRQSIRFQVSGVSAAAGLKSLPASVWAASLILKETLSMDSFI
jgi:hypothetical protein